MKIYVIFLQLMMWQNGQFMLWVELCSTHENDFILQTTFSCGRQQCLLPSIWPPCASIHQIGLWVKCKKNTKTPEPMITKLILIWLVCHSLYCVIIKQSSCYPSPSVAGEIRAELPHTIDVHEMPLSKSTLSSHF